MSWIVIAALVVFLIGFGVIVRDAIHHANK